MSTVNVSDAQAAAVFGTPAPAATDTTAAAAPTGATLMTNAAPTSAPASAAAPQAADPAAQPTAEKPAAAAPVVPEKYEFKAPEGMTLDQAQVDAFSPVAKELGLTQDQAQKLVDLQMAHATQAQAAQVAQWKAITDGWANEARSDKDIGGVKFQENIGIAGKAIDKFGTPELRKALDDSGMGNHPAVVKFFVNVGRQLNEDTMTSGNAGNGGQTRDAAAILFPGMNR